MVKVDSKGPPPDGAARVIVSIIRLINFFLDELQGYLNSLYT